MRNHDMGLISESNHAAPLGLPHSLIGVVLAGGQSSRMGHDKALLSLRGQTFLSIAKQTLIDAGCVQVFLSGTARAQWQGPQIADLLTHQGPVGGMVSCIEALGEEQPTEQDRQSRSEQAPKRVPLHRPHRLLVFVAVDTPLLSARTLNALVLHTVNQSDHCLGARFTNHPLPLVLRLTPHVQAHAQLIKQQLIMGHTCSVAASTEPLALQHVLPDAKACLQLRNINTPEDWSQLNHEFADQFQ
jgi:molybdenum cofactor guanylyltransferase